MPAFGLMPFSTRTLGIIVLLALLAGGPAMLAWRIQDWRYGQQLAQLAQAQSETLNQITQAAATQQKTEQDKRLALEQQLSASEQTHYRALSDAQRDQDRLRDRLATADVRLSVLLDANDVAAGCAVPAATGAGGLDHGAPRARLDPAHAQRIIAITDAGDRGLIALQACQAYIRALDR
ncbi:MULTISPECIES: lysis system i-spanin subunit Rz [unclassified Pseudomonas]|uniref:lysis system i-spanin subunit Rz n=1 Tax=unclassified Pseudomonas TaxID=196821 RepID=UPI0008716DD0|nr:MULTISPECIES: lysis system i-spanin subunit Rz [unclassified Pseudomonas]SCW78486.1 Bacteriophage Rz lysis protein [Pseudomonas sp. NFACC05-1]SCZ24949.1 Bacteriophage Rz lysis protein [Pseudomonas sp. NFACC44-2]SDA65746.1 Bacteriophage Rz lysis protein [Pseudomonas sp. NFACC51]SDX39707.1 Bacteriophage Rz lysis protein [Pseudomonas sp. NFACC08-1]SEI95526.1 Bacteriophage Rz lysis protein [Pseudomonas sp. NFACC07-1]